MSNIRQAINLLEEVAERFENTLSNLHWIENDGHSEDGDYCEKCIQNAKKIHRHRAPKKERSKINIASSSGGYESDYFNSCELCRDYLNVSILPSKQYFYYAIEDFGEMPVSDSCIWQAHQLLCADENAQKFSKLANMLAELVILKYSPINH